ncbi:MAG: aminodeoxychorismate synthase component I [Armatimonadetes bacterium]|nr:aminodeoxychorismate synthase component I [Armatimonadota bacterium]
MSDRLEGAPEEPWALLRAPEGWLRFQAPVRILAAQAPDKAADAVREAAAATRRGLWAVGWVSYEAAPAFDAALPAHIDLGFPAAWFGLFGPPEPLAEPPDAAPAPELAWAAETTPEAHRSAVRRVAEYLASGDTYQVNLTYRMRAGGARSPYALFRAMAATEPPHSAYIDTGRWAICSASPELFYRQEGDLVVSRPMKGTADRGLWPDDDARRARDLRNSEKNRAENLMIVDMVRNDLGRIARMGAVTVPHLFTTERHAGVWQLTSTVTCRTDASLEDVFAALFPAASITGAPKRRTMQIIRELEATPRRVYTGAVGCFAPGRRGRFGVAIRTALVDRRDGAAEYGVGGGIVWDSDPADEWRETLSKARVLRPAPPECRLLETLLWDPWTGWALREGHLRRMGRSAGQLGFRFRPGEALAALQGACAALPPVPHRVRLLCDRSGALEVEAAPLPPGPPSEWIVPAAAPIDSSDPYLYHKTTRRLVYRDAAASRPGAPDVLLTNGRGEITETTIANVAMRVGGGLVTPPVRCGLLPGVRRAAMLEAGTLRERPITLEEALEAGRLTLVNSVRGVWEVRLLADVPPHGA